MAVTATVDLTTTPIEVAVAITTGGARGAAGEGVAAGGTTGQALVKASNNDYDTVWSNAGAGDALTVNPLSQFAATTSAQLRGVLSDETGTGAAVFGTAPTLNNPTILSTIAYHAVGDGTSNPVSEWVTGGARDRGYADLETLQDDYPHVGSLTDEIDWAVIQGELNKIKAGTRESRTVEIPAGTYVFQAALTIYGGGVEICGEGPHGTILKYTATGADGILLDTDDAGIKAHNSRIRKLTLLGIGYATATGCGIVAGNKAKTEAYYCQTMLVEDCIIQGWHTGILGANFPALHVANSLVIGNRVYSFDLAKCDTFLIENCFSGNNLGYNGVLTVSPDALCFNIRDSVGAPIAANFAGKILAGEHGNCAEFLLLADACTVSVTDCNTESFSGVYGDYWIKVTSGDLYLNQVRVDLLTTPVGILLYPDVSAAVRLVATYVDFGIYADPVADAAALIINPNRAQVACRGGDYDTPFIIAPELVVKWQANDGSATWFTSARTDGFVPLKATPHYSRYPDDPGSGSYTASCLALRGRTYRVTRETGYARPDHFVSYYQTVAGTSRHSDLINENLVRTLNATFPDVGNVGVGTDTLATIATEASLLYANGMSIEVEAWGVFGATADTKTIVLTWLSEVFNSGAYAHNGIAWRLRSKIFRESSSSARYVTTFEVDGLAPQIVKSTAAVTTTTASNMVLAGIGTSNNDIVCNGYIVRMMK